MIKLAAFLRRDLLIMLSYRFKIVLNLLSAFAAVFMLFFMGKMFQHGFSDYLDRYGNDYFAFALLGMCVSTFVSTGLYSLASSVRDAQMEGTLEILLVTPTSPNLILFGNSLWSFLKALLLSALYLGAAVVIVGLGVTPVKLLLVTAVLLLTFLCFLSLGMISAAFIMTFKQGNPINMVFGVSSYFFGGILFPVEVLPKGLQNFSFILPISHATRAVRELLLVRSGTGEWKMTMVYLFSFSAVLFPLGFLFLRLALSRAKKEGSLVQF